MADWTQGEETVLLSHQLVTHTVAGTVALGTPLAVAAWDRVGLGLFHAQIEGTNTDPGRFVILGTGSTSGDDTWTVLTELLASAGGVNGVALTADEPGGETVIAVGDTTDYAAPQWVYLDDIDTIAQSEWRRIASLVTNTSITLKLGLTNAKNNADSDIIYNKADVWQIEIECRTLKRIRVDFEHNVTGGTGGNCHVKAVQTGATSVA